MFYMFFFKECYKIYKYLYFSRELYFDTNLKKKHLKVEYLYIVIIFRLFVKIKNDSLTRKISKTFTQTLEQFEVGVSIFQNYPPPSHPIKNWISKGFSNGAGVGEIIFEKIHTPGLKLLIINCQHLTV